MWIVYQNIVFALAVKFDCLALGAVGIANMYLAIFADVGVMILAVLNAIRCLFVNAPLYEHMEFREIGEDFITEMKSSAWLQLL